MNKKHLKHSSNREKSENPLEMELYDVNEITTLK